MKTTNLFVSIALLIAACSKQPVAIESSGGVPKSSVPQATPGFTIGLSQPARSATPAPVEPLTQEAMIVAQKTLDQFFEQRGDTWITQVQRDIDGAGVQAIELKNVTTTIHAEPVTAADTLNGIQWKGVFVYHPVAGRANFPRGKEWLADSPLGHIPGWSQWCDGESFWVQVTEQKNNGQWIGAFALMDKTIGTAHFIPIKPQQAAELAQKQAESKKETHELATFKLVTTYVNNLPDQAVLTDVSVKLHYGDGTIEAANFEDVYYVRAVYSPGYHDAQEGKQAIFTVTTQGGLRKYECFFPDGKSAERMRAAFIKAYEEWHHKFPRFPHAEIEIDK